MRSPRSICLLVPFAVMALLLAGCGDDRGLKVTFPSSSAPPATAGPGVAVGADSACNLLPREEVTPVLGPDTAIVFSGDVRCRYEAGDRLLALQLEKLDVIFEGLSDFLIKHAGTGISEPIDGIGQAAFFNKGSSTINVAVGTQQLELRVVLDKFSADYNVSTDKTAEREALIGWARAVVDRMGYVP